MAPERIVPRVHFAGVRRFSPSEIDPRIFLTMLRSGDLRCHQSRRPGSPISFHSRRRDGISSSAVRLSSCQAESCSLPRSPPALEFDYAPKSCLRLLTACARPDTSRAAASAPRGMPPGHRQTPPDPKSSPPNHSQIDPGRFFSRQPQRLGRILKYAMGHLAAQPCYPIT
jgi:hypothetical protein